MKFVFYTHSVVSDWNHGNAHFLRGIIRQLVADGHSCLALEPADSWSRQNLVADQGPEVLTAFSDRFPFIRYRIYDEDFSHEEALADADVVIVHEWTDPEVVAKVGRIRRQNSEMRLLFHDTHHRAVTAPSDLLALHLGEYDGVLAFGEALSARYRELGWAGSVFTWHEAADTDLFQPLHPPEKRRDLTWVGNWGDGERDRELSEFLVEPAEQLGLSVDIHGVRYPDWVRQKLENARIVFNGWIANADVPEVFAAHRLTVHIPRRLYVESLAGIPTMRVFEALACGIPLISAPWPDDEQLFRPGEDYLVARSGEEMRDLMRQVLVDVDLAATLCRSGLDRIRERHSCRHRVIELYEILKSLGVRMRVAQPEVAL